MKEGEVERVRMQIEKEREAQKMAAVERRTRNLAPKERRPRYPRHPQKTSVKIQTVTSVIIADDVDLFQMTSAKTEEPRGSIDRLPSDQIASGMEDDIEAPPIDETAHNKPAKEAAVRDFDESVAEFGDQSEPSAIAPREIVNGKSSLSADFEGFED
jgi:hypothetical protein